MSRLPPDPDDIDRLLCNGRYILDQDGNPVPCKSLMEWARWMEDNACGDTPAKRIAATEIKHLGLWISTVFLGLDIGLTFSGLPILFETMIFDESARERRRDPATRYSTSDDDPPVHPLDTWMYRYCTRAEAIAGHEIVSQAVMHGLDPSEAMAEYERTRDARNPAADSPK